MSSSGIVVLHTCRPSPNLQLQLSEISFSTLAFSDTSVSAKWMQVWVLPSSSLSELLSSKGESSALDCFPFLVVQSKALQLFKNFKIAQDKT